MHLSRGARADVGSARAELSICLARIVRSSHGINEGGV
jgi:hypothetical protein